MKAKINISGVIGEETTLTDVLSQYKAYEEPTSVDVIIHSEGGDVDEGDGIYDFLKGLDVPVTTITDKAYSISAKIFTAGDTRIVEDVEDAIMIHFAWADVQGKADKLEFIAEELRDLEKDFSSYYSEFLNVDKTTAENLLDAETFISGSKAVSLGFATEIKDTTKIVALSTTNKINLKPNKMKQTKFEALKKAMKTFLSSDINALMLQDSSGTEINFPDLEDDATPAVGDRAEIDSKAIEDGEYIIPSMEDSTVVFKDGVISEIKPKDEEEETEEVEETEEEIEARLLAKKKAEEIKEISVWSVNVVNSSFAEGDVVQYDFDGEVYSVSAGEFQIADGRRIVTDANGMIVKIKDAEEVKEETVEETDEANTEQNIAAMLVKVEETVEARIEAKYKKINEGIESDLNTVKKLLGSKNFTPQARENSGDDGKPTPKRTQAEILRAGRNKK